MACRVGTPSPSPAAVDAGVRPRVDAVPTDLRPGVRLLPAVLAPALVVAGITSGCGVHSAPPAPAEQRTSAPPWDAPRDTVSEIDAAGLAHLPLDEASNPHTFHLTITRNGQPVTVAANIGIDRVRAIQAAVHTHDTTGQVWLEGPHDDAVTLGQFFTVWGVRFNGHCLGDVCGTLTVTRDGARVTGDPTALRLAETRKDLVVAVRGA